MPRRCAGLACHLGKVTGIGCSGNGRCPLEVLADRGVIALRYALANAVPPQPKPPAVTHPRPTKIDLAAAPSAMERRAASWGARS